MRAFTAKIHRKAINAAIRRRWLASTTLQSRLMTLETPEKSFTPHHIHSAYPSYAYTSLFLFLVLDLFSCTVYSYVVYVYAIFIPNNFLELRSHLIYYWILEFNSCRKHKLIRPNRTRPTAKQCDGWFIMSYRGWSFILLSLNLLYYY